MKTLPTVAVDQCEEVAELHGQLMEALAELKASEAELDQLNRILDPLPASADTTSSFQSEIETLRAHQQLPIAKMRFMEARAAWLELAPRYERARSAAAVRL